MNDKATIEIKKDEKKAEPKKVVVVKTSIKAGPAAFN
uniref:Uncharacterized protein n=1 Tax=Hyalangium minutum TaxID=394096 RepID=A0A3Q8I2U8_9BACT|nr:hypothetical protein [Hyalangium minutum]